MGLASAACLLGFGAGSSFGPVNVEITKVALTGQRGEALPLAFGAWGGDAVLLTMLATIFAGASEAGAVDTQHLWVRVLAATMIAGIAIRSLYRGPATQMEMGADARATLIASKGVALSTLSPYGLVLWSGLGAAVVASGNGLAYGAGILLGDGLWFVLWLTILRMARSRISKKAIKPIHMTANAALIGCAALLIFA
ncbi:MAG TPA: LysE family transporter [Solirubrobacterales bacterium]|nr:LysE family transporter [Solirubrobacterales bacterium]